MTSTKEDLYQFFSSCSTPYRCNFGAHWCVFSGCPVVYVVQVLLSLDNAFRSYRAICGKRVTPDHLIHLHLHNALTNNPPRTQ